MSNGRCLDSPTRNTIDRPPNCHLHTSLNSLDHRSWVLRHASGDQCQRQCQLPRQHRLRSRLATMASRMTRNARKPQPKGPCSSGIHVAMQSTAQNKEQASSRSTSRSSPEIVVRLVDTAQTECVPSSQLTLDRRDRKPQGEGRGAC